MRSIECILRDNPELTGNEILKLQEQDKLEDEKEYNIINKSKIAFVDDIKSNGGYFKGVFGGNQKFLYHVKKIWLEENGEIYMDVDSTTLFTKDNKFDKVDITHDEFVKEDRYMLSNYERITKELYSEAMSRLEHIVNFWTNSN